jgi:hypothetical protein
MSSMKKSIIDARAGFVASLIFAMASLYSSLVIGLNIYRVTRTVNREFRPGRFNLTLTMVGIIMGLTGLVLLVRVLQIINCGKNESMTEW